MHLSDLQRRIDRETTTVDPGGHHPVPGTPRWDAQFGRGWKCGLFGGSAACLAGGMWAVIAGGGVGTARGLALLMTSFAGIFLFAFAYLVKYRLGFGWNVMRASPGCSDEVVWPDERPVLYWSFIAVGTLLASIAIAESAWVIVHPEGWAKAIDEHRSTR